MRAAARCGRGSPSSTPTPARFEIIAEPPTETNGSGMPVIGAMPIVMPTFTKTWNRNANTIPAATIAPYRSEARRHDLQPAPDDEQVEKQEHGCADEAALLGDRGEREVGRVRRQIVERGLGRAGHAAAADTAGADRDLRLRQVVGVRVREASRLVGLEHVARRRTGSHQSTAAREQRPDRRRSARDAASGCRRRRARPMSTACRRARCRRRAAGRRARSGRRRGRSSSAARRAA